MTDAEKMEIKALIEKEVQRLLSSQSRVVSPAPKVKHRPILSNQPDATK